MDILISSTSFIPNYKSSWKKLYNLTSNLDFEDYNNIVMSFNKLEHYDALILIFFLQDIDITNHKNLFDIVIENLTFSLKSNKLIYVSISSYCFNNIIRESKKQSELINLFNKFKNKLYRLSKNNSNLFIVDLDIVFSKIGYENVFDSRNWYFSHLRLSNQGIELTDEVLYSFIKRNNINPIKLLLLDCDNTLWGGIVGEDEINGLNIGNEGLSLAYKEFQIAIKQLKKELNLSFQFLKNIGVETKNWILCYPYGAYNNDTIKIIKQMNCFMGLTTKVGPVNLMEDNLLKLRRYDTNVFPQ